MIYKSRSNLEPKSTVVVLLSFSILIIGSAMFAADAATPPDNIQSLLTNSAQCLSNTVVGDTSSGSTSCSGKGAIQIFEGALGSGACPNTGKATALIPDMDCLKSDVTTLQTKASSRSQPGSKDAIKKELKKITAYSKTLQSDLAPITGTADGSMNLNLNTVQINNGQITTDLATVDAKKQVMSEKYTQISLKNNSHTKNILSAFGSMNKSIDNEESNLGGINKGQNHIVDGLNRLSADVSSEITDDLTKTIKSFTSDCAKPSAPKCFTAITSTLSEIDQCIKSFNDDLAKLKGWETVPAPQATPVASK